MSFSLSSTSRQSTQFRISPLAPLPHHMQRMDTYTFGSHPVHHNCSHCTEAMDSVINGMKHLFLPQTFSLVQYLISIWKHNADFLNIFCSCQDANTPNNYLKAEMDIWISHSATKNTTNLCILIVFSPCKENLRLIWSSGFTLCLCPTTKCKRLQIYHLSTDSRKKYLCKYQEVSCYFHLQSPQTIPADQICFFFF